MQMTNRQRVLDAVTDLHNQEQIVTRETLSDVLDLKMSIIDDNLTTLANDGDIHRVQRGVYVPKVSHKKARVITRSSLDDGSVCLEIDRIVLVLTPREARELGKQMMGDAMQYSNIEAGHHAALATAKMDLELKNMRKVIRELQKNAPPAQVGLF